MLESVMIYVYLVLVGLVAGGVTVSGYRLVTNAQPSFQARPTTATGAFGQVLVLVFGGPLVLMRNAVRGRLIEHRPVGFLVATTVISSLWCFFSGVFLAHLLGQFA
ncbi:DUF6949 family protein [Microbaculum sp. FT89]|uniref:DUF6949 family protein n=1 Tax=Microbaculum sp. FT89 TaxID=3447298 RepID=UPI003F52FBB6